MPTFVDIAATGVAVNKQFLILTYSPFNNIRSDFQLKDFGDTVKQLYLHRLYESLFLHFAVVEIVWDSLLKEETVQHTKNKDLNKSKLKLISVCNQ